MVAETTEKWFVLTAAAVFVVTGAAKVFATFSHSRILDVQDPFFGLHFRHLLLLVGIAELAIAAFCLFGRSTTILKLSLIAWISTNFLVYRFGLWFIDWRRPCWCLGNLTDALHIPPATADIIIKCLLAYLLIGSYALLIYNWRQARGSPTAPTVQCAIEPPV